MKEKTSYDKLVGRIGDSYYFCDYIFKHKDDFQGATATVLEPVSRSQYDDDTDPTNTDTIDRFREHWQMAAAAGDTEASLEGFVEDVVSEGDEAIYDLSGYDLWEGLREAVPELTEADYPVFTCIGGGRSFSPDMRWDEIYDNELWKKIKAVETN